MLLLCSIWPEAEAIKDKSANSVAIFLYKTICRYNIPANGLVQENSNTVSTLILQLEKHS